MKYTINGFSQKKLIEFRLDAVDSLILRWFVDFRESGGMKAKVIDGINYYWVQYQYLINEMPIIGISNKKVIYRKLKKLSDCGILNHRTIKAGGTFSYYSIGPEYNSLISSDPVTQESYPCYPTVTPLLPKSNNKDSSIIDSSIIDKNISSVVSLPTNERGSEVAVKNRITEKKVKPVRNKFGARVRLDPGEYAKLIETIGEIELHKLIEGMNEYLEIHGKNYKNYYLALLQWNRKNKENKPKDPLIIKDRWCDKCGNLIIGTMGYCVECGAVQ